MLRNLTIIGMIVLLGSGTGVSGGAVAEEMKADDSNSRFSDKPLKCSLF